MPEGWIGVDTNFGGGRGEYAGYSQQLETIAAGRAAADDGHAVVVLPEGAAGMWAPTVESLWMRAIEGTAVTVNVRAITVERQGYDNVMIELSGDVARAL